MCTDYSWFKENEESEGICLKLNGIWIWCLEIVCLDYQVASLASSLWKDLGFDVSYG